MHGKIRVGSLPFEMPEEGRICCLRFKDTGQPCIRKDIFTPGISAGNGMEGGFDEDLPMDFS